MKPSRILTKVQAFLRAGYPAAAPRQGYVTALALLPPSSTRG
ncbi:DUF3349 domain-containing protein [Mycolicibacterium pyrenivorans]|nr:DUF3349 domain-containing protein [Mycolicibacterium pyrenivorans]MCV7152871.1 DUF3349 domain-containing protein [Mycolicibacterium pyrenivorans]